MDVSPDDILPMIIKRPDPTPAPTMAGWRQGNENGPWMWLAVGDIGTSDVEATGFAMSSTPLLFPDKLSI